MKGYPDIRKIKDIGRLPDNKDTQTSMYVKIK